MAPAVLGGSALSQPSTHFTWEEFRSKDGAALPEELRTNVIRLCQNLEVLREALGGRPIEIVSGYRSPAHNAAVNGAKSSQHMQATAADIAVAGLTDLEVYCTAKRLILEGAMHDGGLGWYANGRTIHYDVRPNRSWYGGMQNEIPLPNCAGVSEPIVPPVEEEEEEMRYVAANVDGRYMRVITNGPQARWVTIAEEDAYWISKLGEPEAVDAAVIKALLGR
jgi:hypothetical protein